MPPDVNVDAVRQRTCGDKRRYRTRWGARHAAERRSQASGDTIRAYRCPFCPSFHIGHVPSMESLEALAEAIRSHPAGEP